MKLINVMFCAGVLCSSVSLMSSTDSLLSLSSEERDSGHSVHTSPSINRKFSIESCVSRGVTSVEEKLKGNFPIKDIIIGAAVVDADIDFLEEGHEDIPRIQDMHKKVENYFVMRGTTLDEYLFASIFYPSDLLLTSADFTTLFSSNFYMQKINAAFVRGISLKKSFSKTNNLAFLVSHYVQEAITKKTYVEYCKKALDYCFLTKNEVLFDCIITDLKESKITDFLFNQLDKDLLKQHSRVYFVFWTVVKELEGGKNPQGELSRYELMLTPLSSLERQLKQRLGGYSATLLPLLMKYVCMKRFDLSFDQDLSSLEVKGLLSEREEIILRIKDHFKKSSQDERYLAKSDSCARYLNLRLPVRDKDIRAACDSKIQDFEDVARYLWGKDFLRKIN